jgi:hypothetical protein
MQLFRMACPYADWLLQIYFPTVYDIKYLMKFCDNLHGGLNKLAESLEVNRMGPQHQVSQCHHVAKAGGSGITVNHSIAPGSTPPDLGLYTHRLALTAC